MSSRKTSLKSIKRYAERIEKMSKRKIDFGEAADNKSTKSHAQLLDIKNLLNDASNRLLRREQNSARNQFLNVVMYNALKKTGSKKLNFADFKKSVSHSNLDQLLKNDSKDKKDKPVKSSADSSHKNPSSNFPKGNNKSSNSNSNSANTINFH